MPDDDPIMLIETTDDLWLDGYKAALDDARRAIQSVRRIERMAMGGGYYIILADAERALDKLASDDLGYTIQHIQSEGGSG